MTDAVTMEIPVIAQLHFVVGTACVIGGAAAFALRKGAAGHRLAGRVFAVCMIALCLSGLYLSFTRSILFTAFLALLALHAVATGWHATAFGPGVGRTTRWIALAGIGLTASGAGLSGGYVSTLPSRELNGLTPEAFYFLAGVAGLVAAIDLVAALRQEISGRRRIARHVWRMGFSFFIASFIFFFGNNHVLPEILRAPAILSAPVVIVLVLILFWLVRVRFGRQF